MKTKGLLSNCLFILKTAIHLNHALPWIHGLLMLVNAAVVFIPIVFLRLLLNEITVGKDMHRIFWYILMMAFATLAGEILRHILETNLETQNEMTLRKMNNYLGEAITRMEFADVEQPKVRDFVMLAKEGTNFKSIFESIDGILNGIITICGLTAIIITLNPVIFLLVFVVVGARLFSDWKNRKLWGKWRPRYAPIMRRSGYFFNIMQNTEYGKEIRLNSLSDWIYAKLDGAIHVYIDAATHHNIELQKNNVFAEVAAVIQEMVVYLLLAYKVVFEGMLIGDFSMYMTSVKTFSDHIRNIVSSVSELLQYGVFANDFRYCIEVSDRVQNKNTDIAVENVTRPLVLEFQHVSFSYPQAERMVLDDISLTLREGESLSIVGMNGAGKSTFVKLLCRFYEPTKGKILLNGIDISTIPYEEYARYLGVVFQDFKLFAFSMEENITMGAVASEDTILKCVEKSGLTRKLNTLPLGLKTNIFKEFDESGIEFSGGEGQKLTLARVLYKNAPIIILDEPTSALDPLAEYEIYGRFHELIEGKCAVYISHRLSSTRFTDKVAVFDKGRLAEYGNHNELVNIPDGIYASMFQMQAQYYV